MNADRKVVSILLGYTISIAVITRKKNKLPILVKEIKVDRTYWSPLKFRLILLFLLNCLRWPFQFLWLSLLRLLSDTLTWIVKLGSWPRACCCSRMIDDRLRNVLCTISASIGTRGGMPAGCVGLFGGSRRHCWDFGFGQSAGQLEMTVGSLNVKFYLVITFVIHIMFLTAIFFHIFHITILVSPTMFMCIFVARYWCNNTAFFNIVAWEMYFRLEFYYS